MHTTKVSRNLQIFNLCMPIISRKTRSVILNWNRKMSHASRYAPLTRPYTKNEITLSRSSAKASFFEKSEKIAFLRLGGLKNRYFLAPNAFKGRILFCRSIEDTMRYMYQWKTKSRKKKIITTGKGGVPLIISNNILNEYDSGNGWTLYQTWLVLSVAQYPRHSRSFRFIAPLILYKRRENTERYYS